MAAMTEDEVIPSDLREALIDRLEGWELVEFLNVSIEDIVELLEYEIVVHIDDLEELVNIKRNNDDE